MFMVMSTETTYMYDVLNPVCMMFMMVITERTYVCDAFNSGAHNIHDDECWNNEDLSI